MAYLPPGHAGVLPAESLSRAAVIEKPYEPLAGRPAPGLLTGRETATAPTHLNVDPWPEVRGLVPDDPAFDFGVNTMSYKPRATLPAV